MSCAVMNAQWLSKHLLHTYPSINGIMLHIADSFTQIQINPRPNAFDMYADFRKLSRPALAAENR